MRKYLFGIIGLLLLSIFLPLNNSTATELPFWAVWDTLAVIDTVNVDTVFIFNGEIWGTSSIQLSGKTDTVVDKNITRIYLKNGTGNYLTYQPYYWDGSAWSSTYNYGFGHNALQNNTGACSNGFGYHALRSNTGVRSNGFGYTALQNNTGNYSNAFGHNALRSNTGVYSNGFGHHALRSNTGNYSNAFGHNALQNNTGVYSNGFGHNALQNNTGNSSNGFGYNALRSNAGIYSNGFGHYALENNTGVRSNGFGQYALQNNTGVRSNGFGQYALQNNNSNYVIALGNMAFNSFMEDNANAQDIDSLDPANNRVVISGGHGFGTGYTNLKISTDSILPSGLDAGIDQWQIVSDSVLECRTDGFSDEGVGTHTLTPSYEYDYSTAIGYDAEPTSADQVWIGADSRQQEIRLVEAVKCDSSFTLYGIEIDSLYKTGTTPDSLIIRTTDGTEFGVEER